MFRTVFTLFLVPLIATAQEKGGEKTFRALYLSPAPNAPEKIQLFDGVASREIVVPLTGFSEVYKLAGGEKTLAMTAAPATKPEEVPAGAPSAKVGAGVTDFYIVINSNPENKVLPVAFQVIDASGEKFRKGQMMWYNLTPVAVGGQLGTQKLAMKGQSRVVVDAPTADAGQYDVALSYVVPPETEFRPICQTQWLHDPRSRTLVFVFGSDGKRVPQVVGFTDFREPAKKPD